MSIQAVLNQKLNLGELSVEQQIQLVKELKLVLLDQIQMPLKTIIAYSKPNEHQYNTEDENQILLNELLGDSADVQQLQQILNLTEEIKLMAGSDSDIVNQIASKSEIIQTKQKIIQKLTLNNSLGKENHDDALDLLQKIRERVEDNGEMETIDILITKKSRFTSDFQDFAQIIYDCFPSEPQVFTSASQICEAFMQKVIAFEKKYSISFRNAINKCYFMEFPTYVETKEHEFIISTEREEYCTLIKRVFEVDTKHPLHFFKVFFKQILSEIQEKSGQQKPLESCMTLLLNTEALNLCNTIFTTITQKQEKFDSIEEFHKESMKYLNKTNKNLLIRINELCQHAMYEWNNQENIEERVLEVSYNQPIFVTAAQNALVVEVLRQFQPEIYLQIVEDKLSCDNYQALFVLDVATRKLCEMFSRLQYNGETLLKKCEEYEEYLVPIVCSWFTTNSTKRIYKNFVKELEKFNKNFINQFINPCRHYSVNIAKINQLCITVSPYQYKLEQSELTQIINENFQLNSYANVLNFYLTVVKPFKAIENAPLLEFFKKQMRQEELAFASRFAFYVFGEVTDFTKMEHFTMCIDKYEPKIKPIYKKTLALFMYEKVLTQKTQFCVSEDFATELRVIAKLFKFDVKLDSAPDFANNILIIFQQIKQDFAGNIPPENQDLVDYLEYMTQLQDEDYNLQCSDSWWLQLARLLLDEDEFQLVLQNSLIISPLEYLRETITRFTTNNTLSEMLQMIDPENMTKYDSFLALEPNLISITKFSGAQEKTVKSFLRRLFEYYVLNKRLYGRELTSFSSLVRIFHQNGTLIIPRGTITEDVEIEPEQINEPITQNEVIAEPIENQINNNGVEQEVPQIEQTHEQEPLQIQEQNQIQEQIQEQIQLNNCFSKYAVEDQLS
ncbi:Conserved_hypothetical protein [Hexamita inflata]|uniref:Uncharacterized protein n=1 Tax=Hexamita inflata TaxID=28002 RepID=A0ABP1JG17_9EUKA